MTSTRPRARFRVRCGSWAGAARWWSARRPLDRRWPGRRRRGELAPSAPLARTSRPGGFAVLFDAPTWYRRRQTRSGNVEEASPTLFTSSKARGGVEFGPERPERKRGRRLSAAVAVAVALVAMAVAPEGADAQCCDCPTEQPCFCPDKPSDDVSDRWLEERDRQARKLLGHPRRTIATALDGSAAPQVTCTLYAPGGRLLELITDLDGYADFAGEQAVYDSGGHAVQVGPQLYTVDLFGQVIEVADDSQQRLFVYDVLGRPVLTGDGATGQGRVIAHVGAQRVAEYDRDLTLVARWIHGQSLDHHLLEWTGDGDYTFYHQDRMASVYLRSDRAGQPVAWRAYTAYGEPREPADAAAGTERPWTLFGYHGHPELDSLGLVAMRARLYRPAWGRFVRAVGPGELADLHAAGRYRVPAGGTEGKYFFETPEQASNFARMMGDQPYTTTSVRVSPSQLGRGQPINPAREGPGYFFDTPNVPSGPVTIFNHSVVP
jgi:hypothetical protein